MYEIQTDVVIVGGGNGRAGGVGGIGGRKA